MTTSKALFEIARNYLPGGVNSPVRAFLGVGGDPKFIQRGAGCYLFDVDGNAYIDYVSSWGPLIVGHAHPYVISKVSEAMQNGVSFGATTEIEVKLASKICELMPSIEMIRFVNSGTEAAMSAIRLARGFTKRNKIIKFSGCYHGHADSLLVSAGSGALTLGVPNSAGVPESIAKHTLVAEYNKIEEVAALFALYENDIAAIIVEPVAGNMNLVLPVNGFLQNLRELCDRYNSLLIFDEVITGFRVGLGGAQAHFGVTPDITILGKVIGGGFPVAAFGGRKEIMQFIAPLGPVYQAGTLSGNPVAMTAGLATLDLISEDHFYTNLARTTGKLVHGLNELAKKLDISFKALSIGGMFGLFFTDQEKIENEKDVQRGDMTSFKQFFHGMLRNGIYLAPSGYEIGFISSMHGDEEINKTLLAAESVWQNELRTKTND